MQWKYFGLSTLYILHLFASIGSRMEAFNMRARTHTAHNSQLLFKRIHLANPNPRERVVQNNWKLYLLQNCLVKRPFNGPIVSWTSVIVWRCAYSHAHAKRRRRRKIRMRSFYRPTRTVAAVAVVAATTSCSLIVRIWNGWHWKFAGFTGPLEVNALASCSFTDWD